MAKRKTLEDFAKEVDLLEEDVVWVAERDCGWEVKVSELVLIRVSDW